jgi:hypothetical protein
MTDIRWEDPPDPARPRWAGRWVEKLQPLMEHPKRWAVVDTRDGSENARTCVNNLRSGRIKTPPGQWEFLFRTVEGEFRVYGRYLGPDQDGGES